MSFINNPVVANIAGAIGLGGLTNQGANPLAASATPTPKVAPAHSAPNQPEYRQARFYDPRAPQGSGGGAPGSMPTEPGAMSPDVQSNPTVSDLLAHFGVHPQQEIDPGLFIHNANAWANHPVMSGVLDGLLGGLANTKGSDTLGEGLSNVAQGLAATHDQRVAHANAQLMMPYQQAMTVASLQDQVGKQKLQEAQQARDMATSKYYDQLPGINEAIQAGHDQARVAAEQERTRGLLLREQERVKAQQVALKMKPPNVAEDVYQKSRTVHETEIAKRDGVDLANGEQLNAAQTLEAAQMAQQDAVVKPKVATAAGISHATLGDKKDLKGTPSAGSTTTPDAQTKAQYDQALKDYNEYNTALPGKRGAMTGKLFVLPGSPEDKAELARRKSALDAATQKLPLRGATPNAATPPSTPQKVTHRFNPVTGTIERVSSN